MSDSKANNLQQQKSMASDSNLLCRILDGQLKAEDKKSMVQVLEVIGIALFIMVGIYSFVNPQILANQ